MNPRAWMCTALGSDLAGLHLLELPPLRCSPNQARVRMRAAALNFPDLLMAQGLYQLKPPMPFIPGMECCGEVVEVGAEVTHLAIGDLVCNASRFGAFAEQVVADAASLRPLPNGFTLAEGAAYTTTALTAWVALVRRGALQPGETLLVHGAAGGTGIAAVQLGRHLGATVVATGRSAARLDAARAAGAQHLILLDDGASNLRQRVLELTHGAGADVVFDPIGGDVFDATLRCIAWGGRLLVVGFAGGRIATLPTNLALIKGFAVIGVRAGEYGRRDPAGGAQNRQAIETLAASGVFRPHIGARYAFEDLPDAYRALAGGQVAGKIVIEA